VVGVLTGWCLPVTIQLPIWCTTEEYGNDDQLAQTIADAKAELAQATAEVEAFDAGMNTLSTMDWRLLHERSFRKQNAAKRLARLEAFAAEVSIEPDPTPASPAPAGPPVRIHTEASDRRAAWSERAAHRSTTRSDVRPLGKRSQRYVYSTLRRNSLKFGASARISGAASTASAATAPPDAESFTGYVFLAPDDPGQVASAHIAIALNSDESASITIARGQDSVPCEPIVLLTDEVAQIVDANFGDPV
jgi:hypothetical protein